MVGIELKTCQYIIVLRNHYLRRKKLTLAMLPSHTILATDPVSQVASPSDKYEEIILHFSPILATQVTSLTSVQHDVKL